MMRPANRVIQIATIFGYDTKLPVRGSEEAAGIDVFVPTYNEAFEKDFEKMNSNPRDPDFKPAYGFGYGTIRIPDTGPFIHIPPHRRVVIPTGLRMKVEVGTYLEVANRGSMAAKHGLIFGAHIIDSDYRGNVFINLINTSEVQQRIDFGQKLAQLLHKSVLMSDVKLISDEEYNRERTTRGDGALGSTGR